MDYIVLGKYHAHTVLIVKKKKKEEYCSWSVLSL